MSGLYHFVLEINGKGGHGFRPDLAHSVIDCFHDIYSNLDTLRLKYIKPNTVLTWSLGSVNAGATFNLIPDKLTCEGSIRMIEAAEKNLSKNLNELLLQFVLLITVPTSLNCWNSFYLQRTILHAEKPILILSRNRSAKMSYMIVSHGWHLKPSVICAACFQV